MSPISSSEEYRAGQRIELSCSTLTGKTTSQISHQSALLSTKSWQSGNNSAKALSVNPTHEQLTVQNIKHRVVVGNVCYEAANAPETVP